MMAHQLPMSALNSLRSGDVVRISFKDIYGDARDGQSFEVELSRVNVYADFGPGGGIGYPTICWKVDEESPYAYIETYKTGWAIASTVEAILSRRNAAAERGMLRNIYRTLPECWEIDDLVEPMTWHEPYHRDHTMVAVSPFAHAVAMLSRRVDLDIPRELSAPRFWEQWKQAGYPGARGSYNRDTGEVSHGHPVGHGPSGKRANYNRSEKVAWWVHEPTFKAWLVKRLPYLVRTIGDLRVDGAAHTRRMEEILGDDY